MQIKFGTDGWRAIIAKDYTTDNVARVAEATALWLKQRSDNPVLVLGYDCRFGGPMFADVVAQVMQRHNVKVLLGKGYVSTPMISLGAKELGATAGVIITASHNPPTYNGYKVKGHYGGPSLPEEISAIEALIPEGNVAPVETAASAQVVDLEKAYISRAREHFDLEAIAASGINLAYDAMYGAGQNVIRDLLPNATLLHCTHDPGFQGRAPEPIHKNLQELSETIRSRQDIHVGLATDGDADRIGMYNERGEFVDAHHLILLLIHYLHKHKGMTGRVVVAFSTTGKIKRLCELYGLPYTVTKVGFKYICGHMVESIDKGPEEQVLVGGEESGGIAIAGHIPERDGIWDGLTLLEYMAKSGKSLDQLVQEIYALVGSFSYERHDVHVEEAVKQRVMQQCATGEIKAFGSFQVESMEDLDGFKFHLGEDRWLMFRASGTEPVLRIYAEGRNREEVMDILDAAQQTML